MEKYATIAALVREATTPLDERELALRLARKFPSYERPEGRVRQFFTEVRNRKREGKPLYGGDIIGVGPEDNLGRPERLWVLARPIPTDVAVRSDSKHDLRKLRFTDLFDELKATEGACAECGVVDLRIDGLCLTCTERREAAEKGVSPAGAKGRRSTAISEAMTHAYPPDVSHRSPLAIPDPRRGGAFTDLSDYMTRSVLEGDRFICSSAGACRASVSAMNFFEGQMGHVGSRYGEQHRAIELRVVVIGMSYGHGPSHVSFEARTEMLREDAMGQRTRTPHMRGTVLALKALYELPVADPSRTSEFIGTPEWDNHIYNRFALVNGLLCSATSSGSGKKDRASQTMKIECRRHLHETLRILDPTVVIFQGTTATEMLAERLTTITGPLSALDAGPSPCLACRFTHPSAWGDQNWSTPERPYFRQVVQPALAEAKRRLRADASSQ